MATQREKAFCVLEFHSTKSVVTVQREFRRKLEKDPPSDCKHDQLLLQNVWHDVEYRLDVCRATNGAHIETNFLVALYNGVRLIFVWLLLSYQ
jgi:hypothetical protein